MKISRAYGVALFWLFLCALPFLLLLLAIRTYGVDVPFNDELFALPPFLEKVLVTGEWTLRDFYGQLNDHRPVVPILFLTGVAWLTQWNAHAELLLSPLLAALQTFLIFRIARHSLPTLSRGTRGLLAFLTSLLLSSLTQWENWSQGINSAFLFATTFLLAAILILVKGPPGVRRTLGAAACCFLASFSHFEGLLTWPALLPLLFLSSPEAKPLLQRSNLSARRPAEVRPHFPRLRLVPVLLWFSLMFLTAILYFSDYAPVEGTVGSISYMLSHPWRLLLTYLRTFGAPFFPLAHPLSAPAGIAVIGMFLFTTTMHERGGRPTDELLPWLCLFLYAALFALLLTLGRGVESYAYRVEVTSRLVASTLFGSIALFHVIALPCAKGQKHTVLLSVLFLIATIANTGSSMRALRHWQERSIALREGKACLEHFETADVSCLAKLAFEERYAGVVREAGRILRTIRKGTGQQL